MMSNLSGFARIGCGLGLVIIIALGGCATADKQPADFSVVLLPDTQNYAEKYPGTYVVQTYWIKDRAKADNTKFAIHLGDIVQNAHAEKEWIVADRAHRILDDAVPYSMVPGNHDIDRKDKKVTRDTKLYNKYFPPSRYEKHAWYGGHEDDDNANNYCLFEAPGLKFMVISLEFAPSDETLQWAGNVINAHKDRRVIIATHYHLRTDGRSKDKAPYGLDGSIGENLWNKFIRKHETIFMVVCGHVGGVYHQTATNHAGKPVHEILCDYQGLANGGDGWLLILRFAPSQNKIHVQAYSPLLDKYNKDPKHTYTLDYDMTPAALKKAG